MLLIFHHLYMFYINFEPTSKPGIIVLKTYRPNRLRTDLYVNKQTPQQCTAQHSTARTHTRIYN